MPRQLPWLSKGSGTRTQAKPAPRSTKKPRTVLYDNDDDDDDDFFAGTVLAPSNKGKQRADAALESDEDSLQGLPCATSPRKGGRREEDRSGRAPSSSPPPMADVPPPMIEFMEKGTSRFDLRDDEWMMVEDEFLQTAKLFTRHLHLAEYKRLKETIQEKRDEAAAVARPIVADAIPSKEGLIKAKADAQRTKQRAALQDILSEESKEGLEALLTPVKRTNSSRYPSTSTTRTNPNPPSRSATHPSFSAPNQTRNLSDTSDSDDLDRPRCPLKPPLKPISTFPKPSLPPARALPFNKPKQSTSSHRTSITTSTSSSSKPPPTSSTTVSKSTHPSHRPTPSKTSSTRTFDLFSELDILTPHDKTTSSSKAQDEEQEQEQANRLAKRKVEREKDTRSKERDREKAREREKRNSVKLDDIPTFLF